MSRWLHARLTGLLSSLYHSTTLAIEVHSSHWSNASGTVPKARLRKARLTTATCNSADSAIAPQSHGLTNRCLNALVVSERALKQVNKLVNTSTVKPAVRAVARSYVPSISPARQVDVDRQQRHHGYHHASLDHIRPHAGVDQPLADVPWLAGHEVVSGRVDAHRQRRRGVGDQVDPQELCGEQWQHHYVASARLTSSLKCSVCCWKVVRSLHN